MAYMKNMNSILKQTLETSYQVKYNPHQLKQDETILVNPYAHIINPYSGDSMLGVSHLSHPMYNNIVPDMIQQSMPVPSQDYIIQELQPQELQSQQQASPHLVVVVPPKPPKQKANARPFECKVCFRRFNQKQTLKQHILTHTGQRPFECNVCFKTFTQQGALQRHMVIHTGEKPFTCTYCQLTFRQKINLHRHMKLHTGAPKEFRCHICDREFSRKGALLRHVPIHDSERPKLQCTCCNKDFLNKESLTRHERNQELREKGIKIPTRKISRNGKLEKIIIRCSLCCKVYRRVKSTLSVRSNAHMDECCIQCSSPESDQTGILRETEIFQCDICQAIFQKVNSFERHKELHSADRKYECDICHLRFKEKRFIRGHIVTHIDICEYQCHMCGLKFKYAAKLKAHYISHIDDLGEDIGDYVKIFQCDACNRLFYQRNQIIRHLKCHEKDSSTRTKSNDEERKQKRGIQNEGTRDKNIGEKAIQEIQNMVETSTDGLGPDNDESYDNYYNDDDDDPDMDFDVPNNTSSIEMCSADNKDENPRSETHPFFCYICKRSYTKKRSLNRHFLVAHTNYEKFPCELCNKRFQTKNSLKQHYVLHKPHSFQCNLCDKTFNRKDALASHKLIHSEKKSFLCPHCPKSFFQKQSLHTHLIQHKGDKSYECGVCGKSFFEKSTLNRHYLSHSGERKYSCHICNMSFIQKNHLDKHFLRHDEIEKKITFECEKCDKTFYRKDHYLRHRESHAENRTLYPCTLCDRKFTDKYSLARHVKYKKCKTKTRGRGKKRTKTGESSDDDDDGGDENEDKDGVEMKRDIRKRGRRIKQEDSRQESDELLREDRKIKAEIKTES